MKTIAHVVLLAVLALAPIAHADTRYPLSKNQARTHGLRFVRPFVDLLDLDRHVATRMDPPRKCMRLSRFTVTCRFTAELADGRAIRSRVRVHRQRDGLLGFWMPLDVLRDGLDG